ncbi:MAG TPA: PAS domain S-box protein, partial [Deferrisomatales bacterium]|nr:PAS domain S-box protein [Deferrisomatales bacterium]
MGGVQERSERVHAGPKLGLGTYVIGLTVLWTLTLTASLGWLLHQQRIEEKAAAAITARVSYEADVKYLSWLSALGGLFVNAEVEFPPDPHLGGAPGSGILLPDGTKLMPLTPIYVLRLVHALDIMPLEVSSRLTSLTPVVPEDVPDPWEAEALGALSRGQRERVDLAEVDGENYLRLMKPLRLGQDCINCHEKEGYREGFLQGGISVTVPMDRPEEFGRRSDAYLYAVHAILWLLGTGFIGYGARSLSARIRERDQALEEVSDERNFSDSVLETVGALVVVLDSDGRIIRFNRACEEATGYRFAEVRDREVWDLLLPEDREAFRKRFDRLRIDQVATSHETPWVGKDGVQRIISWFDRPLVSARGTVGHVIATGIDVTEKRRTELALQESEERYRGLVESSPDAVFVHQDGRFVFCNVAGAKLLGVAGPRDLVGMPIMDFTPPVQDGGRQKSQAQWLPEAPSEQTLRGLNGEIVEAEVAGIPFQHQGREAVQVIARDIGARKRAEQALRDSEARYRTLVENVDLGITLVGQDYRVVMANAAQGRLLNRDPTEFVDKQCFREFEGRDSACPHCPGSRAMRSGEPASIETVRVRGDGVSIPVRVQAFPILGPDGEAKGFIEVSEDITALKNAEEERLRLEQKFVQTQKLESLGVLAGGIAHDFNNLLMGVVGNVDLALRKSSPDSPLRRYLHKIDDAAQRAAELTNQMLAYSGKGKIAVEPVHMSHLVGEVGHLLDTVVSKKATLQYQLAPELPPVEADATQLRQVVMNLITNASDALDDRAGTVTVSTGVVHADRACLAGIEFGDSLVEGAYV